MRVLQINVSDAFRGAEKIELEWFRNIDKSIKFDFLTPDNKPFKDYENEINILGGNVYNLGISRDSFENKIIYAYRLYKFFKCNKFDIIHINNSAFLTSFHVVLIAKICRQKKIIVHSHNAHILGMVRKTIKNILNPLYRKMINACISCSEQANNALFTKKFIKKNKIIILKNGIEIDKYKFDEELRNKYIKEFNLYGKKVYGNVGSFAEEKNHLYLIDLFNKIQEKEENAILLLVGDGSLKEQIKERVEKLDLTHKVIFLGYRKDVNEILNCMDIFIFPSIYEGLGIALVEAQTNGLLVYASDSIPTEVNISPFFNYFNLKDDKKEIAKKICEEKINILDRKFAYKNTIENDYDIKDTCRKLEKIYYKIYEEEK